MSNSTPVDADILNDIASTNGNQPFFLDFDVSVLKESDKSYEEQIMDGQHPGRELGRHLVSPDTENGTAFWNTETDNCIAKFKQISGVVDYSLKPICMVVCNVEKGTLDLVAPPANYPVIFGVSKRVCNEFVLVKYLVYTATGSMCHYTPK